jgi:hypothetical protein
MKKFVLIFAILILSFNFAQGGIWTVADLKADMQFYTRGNLGVNDSVWIVAINAGIWDLATMVDCTIDTGLVVCSTGTAIYDLPTDCVKLRGVRDVVTGRAIDMQEMNQEGKAGTGAEVEEPKISWTTRGVKMMILYPTPAVDETLLIFYLKEPVIVNADTDTISTAPAYNTALTYACLAVLYTRLERWDAANNWSVRMINKVNNIEIWMNKPGPDVIIGKRVISRTE